jgi:hypothetical protein
VGKASVFEVSVADAFNPYSQWLGIEASGSPNHYELLRIAPSEADAKTIAAAAAAQMAKIRGIRPGPRLAEWQRVLDELAAAKDCLSEEKAKARYDDQLRQRGKPSPGARTSAPAGGKNLLPPSKSTVLKRAEAISTSAEALEPSLNPMPPGRSAKPSSSAAPAKNPAVADPSPRTASGTPSPVKPLSAGGPGMPLPAAGQPLPIPTAPGGFPNRPLLPQGTPFAAVPFPGSPFPGSPFPNMPFPGAPMPGAAMPAGQGAQPSAAPVHPSGPGNVPSPSSAPGSPGPNSTGGVLSQTLPVATPIATREATQTTDTPTDEWTSGPYVRPIKPAGARQKSSHIATIVVGIVVGAALAVGIGIVINNHRHETDAIADASNTSSSGTFNPNSTLPAPGPSNPPSKSNDPTKPNPPLRDPHVKSSPPREPQKDPNAGPSIKPRVNSPPRLGPMKEPTPMPPPESENPLIQPPPMAEPLKPMVDPPKPMADLAKPMADPPAPMPVDSVQAAKLHRALAAARTKLGERNQEEAKKLIAAATQLAVTPEQHDEVDRFDALEKYVGEFWSAVRDSVKNLKATDEIDLGSTKVIVVEASADAVTIHVGGANRRYQVNQLPSGLAVGLALRWLDPKKPENKVFVGAFYLVDPKTGPEQAKQAWDEAAAAGVDVKNLLPLLQPDKADAALPEADASRLAVVPDKDVLAKAEKKVREEMDAAFAEAKSASKKSELAKKLIEQGDSIDDPARRFVMWREARDLAAEAGQPAILFQAVDHLAGQFRIDPLDMKADALANSPPKTTTVGRTINEAALKLAEEALAANRPALAKRFLQIALTAAKATSSVELMRRTQQRAKEVQDMAVGGAGS